jgi:hypothetical protein
MHGFPGYGGASFAGLALSALLGSGLEAQPGRAGEQRITLRNPVAQATFCIQGGALVDFHLHCAPVNPLSWDPKGGFGLGPHTRGHYVCFDRWGPSTAEDYARGIPVHGEAHHTTWDVIRYPQLDSPTLVLSCRLPVSGLELHRRVRLAAREPVLTVVDTVRNPDSRPRIYNLIQHASLGPPFLNASTRIDTNAERGCSLDKFVSPEPWTLPQSWPVFQCGAVAVDLRYARNCFGPGLLSLTYPPETETAWVTAVSPEHGVLLGYAWDPQAYPWLNLWRYHENTTPAAFGLEPGTTGVHTTFPELLELAGKYPRPLVHELAPGQSRTYEFTVFLARVDAGFRGVDQVEIMEEGEIRVREAR